MTTEQKKTCFVISPIGAEGSKTRERSDTVYACVIEPVVVKSLGYTATRAHELAEPGSIPHQIIEHLYKDKLVIADLAEKNANVFYELGVRHSFGKPVVLLYQEGESIPFDIASYRAIPINLKNPLSVKAAGEELEKHIRSLEDKGGEGEGPVHDALSLAASRLSDDPNTRLQSEIMSQLLGLRGLVADMHVDVHTLALTADSPSGPLTSDRMLEALLRASSAVRAEGTVYGAADIHETAELVRAEDAVLESDRGDDEPDF